MAHLVAHTFVSPVVDDLDPNEVGPDEWNANHAITIDASLIDHGGLTGLADNDHPQYFLAANVAALMRPPGQDGEEGPQGWPGPVGLTGSQGIQGIQGIQGPAGIDGEDGVDGIPGPVGPIGPTGATGSTGPIGLTGSQGMTGLDGEDGADGWLGPVGPMGPQGPIGLTGPPGLDGEDGEMGWIGPIGPMGPQGPQGIQGPPGLDGEDGIDGLPGLTILSANPTGTVGLATVNGTAKTFMRSDAAPPLSQAITPTWTGLHIYDQVGVRIQGTGGYFSVGVTGAPTNVTAGDGSFKRLLIGTDAAFTTAYSALPQIELNIDAGEAGVGGSSAGLTLITPTAATSGHQMASPALTFIGNGWKTNATASSQPVTFSLWTVPIQAAAGDGYLGFHASVSNTGVFPFNVAKLTFGGVWDVSTGFRIGGAAADGSILLGNGTNYVAQSTVAVGVAYSAGDFTASTGTMTIGGVGGANLLVFNYFIVGKWMTVTVFINGFALSNATNAFYVKIPASKTASTYAYGRCAYAADSGGIQANAIVSAQPGDTRLYFWRSPSGLFGGENWAQSGAGGTTADGAIICTFTFPIS